MMSVKRFYDLGSLFGAGFFHMVYVSPLIIGERTYTCKPDCSG